MYVGGCTKDIGRSRSLRWYSSIQAGSCAVLRRCNVTCLSELNRSTSTCRTSPYLRHLFLLYEIIRLCRLFSIFVFTPFMRIIGVSRQDICHGGTRTNICYGTDECLTHIFSTYLRPENEEHIITHHQQQERSSPHLIPLIWSVVLFSRLMIIWVMRRWVVRNCIRPCTMLGKRWNPYWPGGVGGLEGSMPSRSMRGWCLGLMCSTCFQFLWHLLCCCYFHDIC